MRFNTRIKQRKSLSRPTLCAHHILLFIIIHTLILKVGGTYARSSSFSSFTTWDLGILLPFKRSEVEQRQVSWRGREQVTAYPLRLDQTLHWHLNSSISLKVGGRFQATDYQTKAPASSLFALTQAQVEWTPVSTKVPKISLGLHRLPYGLAHPIQRWGSISRLDSLWSFNPNPLDRLGTGIQFSSQSLPFTETHPFTFPRRVNQNRGAWFYQITAFVPTQPNGRNFNTQQWALWTRGGYTSRSTLIELQFHQAYLDTPKSNTVLNVGSLHGQHRFFSSPTPLIYRGEILLRDWSSPLSPLEEANLSLLDQSGTGLQVHHQVEWQIHPTFSSWLAYSWQDPHVDFGYDTRHQLSIMMSWHHFKAFQILTIYHHHWSASQNRWSFSSDELLFCIRGDLIFE